MQKLTLEKVPPRTPRCKLQSTGPDARRVGKFRGSVNSEEAGRKEERRKDLHARPEGRRISIEKSRFREDMTAK